MRALQWTLVSLAAVGTTPNALAAAPNDAHVCAQPSPGSEIAQPRDIFSTDGVLKVDLRFRGAPVTSTSGRYCYELADGTRSPTLRLRPGDLLILRLKNELPVAFDAASTARGMHMQVSSSRPCASGVMSAISTNLHFHGLAIPPVCHADEVLRTSIQPK